jgi:hypothetical protein
LLQNATHLAVGAAAAGVPSGPFIDKNRVINAARHGTIFIICLLSTALRHYSTKSGPAGNAGEDDTSPPRSRFL